MQSLHIQFYIDNNSCFIVLPVFIGVNSNIKPLEFKEYWVFLIYFNKSLLEPKTLKKCFKS